MTKAKEEMCGGCGKRKAVMNNFCATCISAKSSNEDLTAQEPCPKFEDCKSK